MLELDDDSDKRNDKFHFAWASMLLVGCMTALMIWFEQLDKDIKNDFIYNMGLIPGVLFKSYRLPEASNWHIPAFFTIVTSSFIHGSGTHYISNMLLMCMIANNVEEKIGGVKMIIIFVSSCIVGNMAFCAFAYSEYHILRHYQEDVPLVGGSAGICALFIIYILLHPNIRFRLKILSPYHLPFRIPAYVVFFLVLFGHIMSPLIKIWENPEIDSAFKGSAEEVGLVGFLCGAIAAVILRRQGIEFFDKSVR